MNTKTPFLTALALTLPLAGANAQAAITNGLWGLKTHDPVSQAPTTLFRFSENPPGTGATEIGRVKLSGTDIEADALAISPAGALCAFQVGLSGGSRLISLNPVTATATVIGPGLAGRNVRGAMFTLAGRLLAFDTDGAEVIEVNPGTGQVVGAPLRVPADPPGGWGSGTDLTQAPDGSCLFAGGNQLFRLDLRRGTLALLFTDTNKLADGWAPYCTGLACSPLAVPDTALFAYDVSIEDDIYSYLPASGWSRVQHVRNIVPAYNAGRGDLAALPAARVEVLNCRVSGTNAVLETVCRGGCWAEVVFTDALKAPNWQVVPGSRVLVPFTAGTIATPQTWTNLPADVPHRFFRVRVDE
jgi:hypothetical protein